MRVHFVTPDLSEVSLTEAELRDADLETLPTDASEVMSRHGKWVWSLRTHLELKRVGYHSTAGPSLQPGAINVGHRDTLRVLLRTGSLLPRSAAVVVCQADKPRLWGAGYRVQQCPDRRGIFVPHWPERGLVPRDGSRGNRLENVAFFGLPPEREMPVHTSLERQLAERGFAYQVNGGPASWKNYADVDVSVALRSEWRAKGKWKPASKLQNAHICGVHFVATPEPSYTALDPAQLTWTPARTVRETIDAIETLRSDDSWFDSRPQWLDGVTEESLTQATVDSWVEALEQVLADHAGRPAGRGYIMRVGYQAGLGHVQRGADLIDTRIRARSARRIALAMVDV